MPVISHPVHTNRAAKPSGFWLLAALPRRPPKFLSQRRRRHSNSKHQRKHQAPSTKHQAEQEQAISSSVRPPGWVSLAASGFWLLASGFMVSGFCLARSQIFWAYGAIDGRWETTPPPSRLVELTEQVV
jgi:hypothetical protein